MTCTHSWCSVVDSLLTVPLTILPEYLSTLTSLNTMQVLNTCESGSLLQQLNDQVWTKCICDSTAKFFFLSLKLNQGIWVFSICIYCLFVIHVIDVCLAKCCPCLGLNLTSDTKIKPQETQMCATTWSMTRSCPVHLTHNRSNSSCLSGLSKEKHKHRLYCAALGHWTYTQ